MRGFKYQRGEGRAGCIFWTLVLAAGIFVAAKIIPVKIATAELKDKMEEAAQLMPRGREKEFVDFIVANAVERDLPVTRKDVKVKKSNQRVTMDVSFTVPIDLIVTTYDWDIDLHVDRDIFII